MSRLACLLAVLSLGAAPPDYSFQSPAQLERARQELVALREANAAFARRDRAGCVAALERGLAIERELFGHVRPKMLDWLVALAQNRAALGRIGPALEARREALA